MTMRRIANGFYEFPGEGYICRYIDGWVARSPKDVVFPSHTKLFATAWGAASALLRAVGAL